MLTGRAIENKNKRNYGRREGLAGPSFCIENDVAKLFYDPFEREEKKP